MRASLARSVATVGGLGDRLPAPGTTVGSLAAVVCFAILSLLLGDWTWLGAALGLATLVPLAVVACGAEAARRGEVDPGAIVLDEVAGQWLALSLLALAQPEVPSATALGLSFVLFRVFDVLKPWPISRLERLAGGVGIVADDLAAGLAAGTCQLLASRWLILAG